MAIVETVKELEQLILKHKALYYQGVPEIEDGEYDLLEEKLRRLDRHNKVLFLVGSEEHSLQKVKHTKKMLSLAKVYDFEDLEKWRKNRDVVSTHKIDGVSCSLIYREGILWLAKTRGDGNFGEDITEKVKWMANIPSQLPRDESIEIRGELLCTQDNFTGLCNEMERIGLDRPVNQRNIVAGLVHRKDHIELARYLAFYAFDILPSGKFQTEEAKHLHLKQLGFDAPTLFVHKESVAIEKAITQTKDLLSQGDYAIDGLVFTFNDLSLQEEMGETNHHPRYKMAFKYKSVTKSTVIEEISWCVSRNGILTPVAQVQPVHLSGAEITRVTLHNYGVVREHRLKKGDKIVITRSGEVIPKFLAVETPSREGRMAVPSRCPSCQHQVVIEDIRIFCHNPQCPARIQESILNFIVKIGIEDLSTKRLEEMINKGLVGSIPDLYDLSVDDLLSLDKTKETLANKLHGQIQRSKTIPLTRFLSALGLQGGAYNRCEKIVQGGFDTIDKILALTVEDVSALEGFAEKSASHFVGSLHKKKTLVATLLKKGFSFKNNQKSDGRFLNKRICITGALSEKRSVVEEKMRKKGAVPVNSLSKKTDFLVTNDRDKTSTKLIKAKEWGVAVISERELMNLLGYDGTNKNSI